MAEAKPPTSMGVWDEGADGVEIVEQEEDIPPDASASLTVDLEPGTDVLVCTLPGHSQSGMHATFNVT